MALTENLRPRLGAIVLALVPAASLLVLMLRPIWDLDVFWQLRLGELTLANAGPLAAEPFAARHLGEPLPALAWLGQAVMALERQTLGWTGLRLIDALCWLGGFWAAALAARRNGASLAGLALALPLALVMPLSVASIRPQSLAALCFGLLLLIASLRGPAWKRVILSIALMVLWQNLHPSVAVAGIWAGSLAAPGWLGFLARRRPVPPWEHTAIAVGAALAMVMTPDGFGIFATSATNSAASRMIGVSEWLPLWEPVNRWALLPMAEVSVIGLWLVFRSRRFEWREAVPMLVFLALTVLVYRFVLFWSIALVPVLARTLEVRKEVPAPRWLMPLALGLALGLTLLVLPTRFKETIPVSQIAELRKSGVKGTIFAWFPWGGPVIDAGYPEWKVAYDGRYYRYTREEWEFYHAVSREPGGLAKIEAAFRPSAFVLEPDWDAPLVAELRTPGSGWREISGLGPAAIFVPDQTGQPQRRPAAISSR